MKMAHRLTMVVVATAVALANVPVAAQTVSRRCSGAVSVAHPEVGTVWVATVLSRGDQMVANWQSANGTVGTCTMSTAGEVVDVSVTGTRPAAAPVVELGPGEVPEIFDPYLVTCESTDGSRVECAVKPFATVSLVEVQGDTECLMDSSWGHDDGVVWVDKGCRASFEVRPGRIPEDVAAAPAGAVDLKERVGQPQLRTLEGRAQNACLRAARGQGIAVTDVFATRAEGDYVVVLMAVATWAQKADVTCRYDPTNDRAAIVR